MRIIYLAGSSASIPVLTCRTKSMLRTNLDYFARSHAQYCTIVISAASCNRRAAVKARGSCGICQRVRRKRPPVRRRFAIPSRRPRQQEQQPQQQSYVHQTKADSVVALLCSLLTWSTEPFNHFLSDRDGRCIVKSRLRPFLRSPHAKRRTQHRQHHGIHYSTLARCVHR